MRPPIGVPFGDGFVVADRTPTRKRAHTIELQRHGEMLFSDQCKLDSAADRQRWAQACPGLDPAEVAAALLELDNTISAPGAVDRGDDDDVRPWVDLSNGDLTALVKEVQEAVIATNDPPRLYRYGNTFARVGSTESGAARVEPITDMHILRYELSCHMRFHRPDGEDAFCPALPPFHAVHRLLAVNNDWLPALNSVISRPTFDADGRLHAAPGYDAGTRLWYAPAPGLVIPPVPTTPGQEEMQHAVRLINELLHDFPFARASDKAHAMAFLFEQACRPLIKGPLPLHLIEAATPGTGKTLLAQVLLSVAVGDAVAAMSPTTLEEEQRKRLLAALLEAPGAIFEDNVTVISGNQRASVITAPFYRDRLLGASKVVEVPVRNSWIATGNNVVISQEMARRTVRTRLDARVEQPWQRNDFRHTDLTGWVEVHLGDLVWAILTLVQAWKHAGYPAPPRSLGGFEAWSKVIGGILCQAGVPSFLEDLNDFYEVADLEGAMWRTLVASWWERFGNKEVSSAQLFDIAIRQDDFNLGSAPERAQRTTFGMALASKRDQIINGYRITGTRKAQRAQLWSLTLMAATPTEGEPSEPR